MEQSIEDIAGSTICVVLHVARLHRGFTHGAGVLHRGFTHGADVLHRGFTHGADVLHREQIEQVIQVASSDNSPTKWQQFRQLTDT